MSIVKNASLKEIGYKLQEAESILIFVHQNPDGDALGSSTALCKCLREQGKTSYILLEEEVPAYLDFMETECCTLDRNCLEKPDVSLCIDCSEYSRFDTIQEIYDRGNITICLDHHLNANGFGEYYYIDPEAAAAAELIYHLIREMDWVINRPIANAIYIGLSSDTGNFKYSNTRALTHRIAMELFEIGVDHNDIMVQLYQNTRIQEVEVRSMAISSKKMLAGGRGAITCVTEEILSLCNAKPSDAETVIDGLRDIKGVEIAAVLKQRGDQIKVSLRAKSWANVAVIAQKFGGGGHVKAAGCTLKCDMNEAERLVSDAIEKALQ